jgi:RNA polymerase sigma-70 factor (ECF subfamily)
MATMGLALPWEAKISSEERRRGKRVESSQYPASGLEPVTREVHPEDLELAAACQAGEMLGYERLYSLHGKRMKSIARNLLGSTTDAEDAVQETFMKVQRSIGTFRAQSSFVTWTFRILINTCYDVRRSRMRKKEVTSEGTEENPLPEPKAPGSHPSLKLALEHALKQLTNQKNTLFQAKKNLRTMLEPPRSQSAEAR